MTADDLWLARTPFFFSKKSGGSSDYPLSFHPIGRFTTELSDDHLDKLDKKPQTESLYKRDQLRCERHRLPARRGTSNGLTGSTALSLKSIGY